MRKLPLIKNFRWWIVGLIALATAINYLDRQNLPVALSEIRKNFEISDVDYGLINSLFLFAYGTMYAVGGRIIDVLGSRLGYFILIVWWSIANMLHGLVSNVMGLGIARFLLGIGEGGAFPGSAKVVSEWFPKKERALAFGIFNTGSSVGAVVAPPVIALIIATWSWQWTFFIFGIVGLVWAAVWWMVYAVPSRSKFVTAGERALIAAGQEEEQSVGQDTALHIPWISLFRYRKLWGLLAIKFLPDAGWYFFIFWLPKYLNDVRGLDIQGIGSYAWIPYAMAGGGSFLGGWLSSFLLRKQFSLDLSRKIPLGIAAALLPLSLFIADASLLTAVFLFGMAMCGHQLYSTIVQTLVADMFPSRVVGSVSGLMGCAATYGAMLFSLVIGFIIDRYGYGPAFFIAGLLHPLSFILLFVIIKRVEMISYKLNS
ncbi:MFS transporter [Parapedobacter koreensis]|uniref:MFS transporter, ACS family, hexuronate transporter n=1 Tax=Parapedobacter koreensis TaxID=332977 RepID=A0A1H7TGZ6_9SPHI|nr:MFS transporter [Parapedobacter koreensis]SEL84182.1 MFS transporter, ACS family, hexuronate transporter [Parapedobacter koreensis]